jgi:hypothetical protein
MSNSSSSPKKQQTLNLLEANIFGGVDVNNYHHNPTEEKKNFGFIKSKTTVQSMPSQGINSTLNKDNFIVSNFSNQQPIQSSEQPKKSFNFIKSKDKSQHPQTTTNNELNNLFSNESDTNFGGSIQAPQISNFPMGVFENIGNVPNNPVPVIDFTQRIIYI